MTVRTINTTITGPVTFGSYGTISVTNLGVVTATGTGGAGIAINGNPANGRDVLINSGQVSGSVVGVYVAPGEIVTNQSGGRIEGGAYGVLGFGAITNAGTIAGGTFALHFYSDAGNRLVADPGAVFIGTVAGGVAADSGGEATLEFASGASGGTFSGLGSHYVNFQQISVDAGATWTAGGTNTIASGQTLTDGGSLTFTSAPVGSGSLAFGGSGITLAADGGASFGPSIVGLLGNTIELVGVAESSTALNGYILTLSGGTTLSLGRSYTAGQIGVTNNGTDTFITACFAGGTEIMTARGPIAVEALREGEHVMTASGRLAPVAWIGHRRVDLRRHVRPDEVMPVRVLAGALGDGVPARDLLLSPDHAVLVDGYLVPVRYLVNGQSIVQERREAVTYWHVELDRHDLVLAEGAACESYLDTGNRDAFEGEAAMALHPEFGRDHALAVWEARSCAPILFDPADLTLRGLHLGLMVRAERLARAA